MSSRPAESQKRPGSAPARLGLIFTLAGVVLSWIASVLTGLLLVHAEQASPHRTVKGAFDAGDSAPYVPSLVAIFSQPLWVLLVLVGFILLIVGFTKGQRRAWVWIAAVFGPLGLLLSVAIFVATLGLAVS